MGGDDMSGKHPIPDAALRCKSCGRLWVDHPGIQPTCAENIELRARVAELEAENIELRALRGGTIGRVEGLCDALEAELARGARNER